MAVCVGALLIRGEEVLLGRRAAHKTYPGHWDLVGGHVEPGESPEAALSRELREEIGVTPTEWVMLERYEFTDEGAASELLVFKVTSWSGEPALANDEHIELRWHPLSDASELEFLASDEYRPLFHRMNSSGSEAST